ncbi:hypothetical protein SORBI_3005G210850 [Sorghum bicolor]|uniref:Uncharacterized protein n=1 Tax=Sorghum bicolor TaxID=4558 RepID=A0A1Z5RJR2_SORBI|nr:hypothetical protein SORBI_3005G210850 [Sorghum bicolor]
MAVSSCAGAGIAQTVGGVDRELANRDKVRLRLGSEKHAVEHDLVAVQLRSLLLLPYHLFHLLRALQLRYHLLHYFVLRGLDLHHLHLLHHPLTAASAVPAAALAMALRGLRRTNPVRPLPLASTASEAVSVASDASETFECSSGGGLCRWRRGSPISSIRCRRKHRSAIAAAASCRGQDVQVMGGWRAGCAGKRDFALLGVVNPLLAGIITT